MSTTTIECADGLTLDLTCTPFEPVTAYTILALVGKVLVPAALAAKNVSGTSNVTDLLPAARALFEQLTPELAQEALIKLLAGTSVVRSDAEGKIDCIGPAKINRAFRGGNLKAMLLAVKHSLEVNYGSFFVVSPSADGAPDASEPVAIPSA